MTKWVRAISFHILTLYNLVSSSHLILYHIISAANTVALHNQGISYHLLMYILNTGHVY